MKILFAMFAIAKYGGVVNQIENRIKAFKDLGHDVDLVQLKYDKNVNESQYQRKIAELESGEFQNKIEAHSQNGGFEKSEITGYWRNNYYGWILQPIKNAIPVFNERGLEWWKERTKDVDVIFWDFIPTRQSESEGFSDWWKYFDLPKRTKQVLLVHDAYMDMRVAWLSALKDKIQFLDCCHIAGFNACENFDIPRICLYNWRLFPEKMEVIKKSDRTVDFSATHIFKSMKKMEEILRAVPYLNSEKPFTKHSVMIAGSGIEYSYMTSETKCKPSYMCTVKNDPDLPKQLDMKKSLWNRALEFGMTYLGQIGTSEVNFLLENTKFAVDASWAKHYAQYCRTHINGFMIEAIIKGCYPIYRDYKGLTKNVPKDELFDSLRAIVVPWDATPKQFGEAMKKAMLMDDKKFLEDTQHNFNVAKKYFGAQENAKTTEMLLCLTQKELIDEQVLEIGNNSKLVTKQTEDAMLNFFKAPFPIIWNTK